MNGEIVLAGPDVGQLIDLSLALRGKQYEVSILHAHQPLAEVMKQHRAPAAIVMVMCERENVADLRALMSRWPTTAVLVLTPDRPPAAAIARIVRSFGCAVLPADEPNVVVVATVIALAAIRGSSGSRRA
jgi:hypothetical protein